MRQWEEASWDAGRSQTDVIAQAGHAIALAALRLTRENGRILVLAGKGHNGDDARSAVPHLSKRQVQLFAVRDAKTDLSALDRLLQEKPALVIDGIFGIGLNRPLDQAWVQLIERVNRAALPVLAVDVPSGLNADSGEPQPVAVFARTTVTLGAPKRGLLAASGSPFVGRLELAGDIGLLPCPFSEELRWSERVDFADYPPARRVEGHKGSFGHVAILAGSEGYHGAAVLAARGALRSRPGLVSVFCERHAYAPVASQLQAAMVHPFKAPLQLPASCSALVAGPGLAAGDLDPAWKDCVNHHWRASTLPVIVDASALAWLEKSEGPATAVRVATPHPGEAARLLGATSRVVQDNRIAALREISSRYGNCWVVLKGHQTLIGRSTGELFINSSGNPDLAQGGSGDVLAGFIGGLLAQPALQNEPLRALRYAVWAHGDAADYLTGLRRTWTIEELVQRLGDVDAI